MSFVQLPAQARLFRDHDGSLLVLRAGAPTLRFGPAYAAALQSLSAGITRVEWQQRTATDPAWARIGLALSDNGLLESVIRPRTADVATATLPSPAHGRAALAGCAALLALGAGLVWLMTRELIQVAILPWWVWPVGAGALVLVALLHESAHATAARACGMSARISLWRHGGFLPRCVVRLGPEVSARRRLWFLAAGPLTDAMVLAVATLTLGKPYLEPAPKAAATAFACVAAASLLCNLRPSAHSDFGRMIDLAAAPALRRALRAAAWSIVVVLACLAFRAVLQLLLVAAHA